MKLQFLFAFALFVSFISIPGITYGDAYGKECYFLLSTGISASIFSLAQFKYRLKYSVTTADILLGIALLVVIIRITRVDNRILIVLCLIIWAWLTTKLRTGKVGISIFFFFGLIHSVMGIKQLFSHFGLPISGLFSNPGVYANYLIPFFAIALGLLLWEKKIWGKAVYLLCLSLIAMAIIFSQARAGVVAMGVSAVFLLEFRFKLKGFITKSAKSLQKIVTITVTIVLLCIFFSWGIIFFKPDSVKGRLLIYAVSMRMIAQKPIFGYGLNKHSTLYPNFQANYFKENPDSGLAVFADNTKVAFNEFLQIFTELGVVGFMLIITILYYLFSIPITPNNKEEIILWKAALLGIVVSGFFSYPLRNIVTALNATLISGILASYDNRVLFSARITKKLTMFSLIIAFSASIYLGKKLYDQYKGYLLWTEAVNNKPVTIDKTIEMYMEIYPLLKSNGLFLYNYGVTLSIFQAYESSNKVLNETLIYFNDMDVWVFMGDNYKGMNNFNDAEKCYIHASHMIPCRFYPLFKLAQLYKETNNKDKLHETAQTIIDKPIKILSYTISAIKKEMHETLNQITNK